MSGLMVSFHFPEKWTSKQKINFSSYEISFISCMPKIVGTMLYWLHIITVTNEVNRDGESSSQR